MPLYEYRCHSCGKVFEVMQKFADEPLKVHPDCGGEVERLISAPGLHFKGTGWYVTDYARGNKSGAPSPSSGEGKSDSKDSKDSKESKSDTKTETKTESTKSETKSDSKPAST